MNWFFEDEANPYADSVLASLKDGQAHVPSIWLLEATNAFISAEKRNRITGAKVLHNLNLLKVLNIKIDYESPLIEIYSLARQFSLTSYDTSYLELAMRLGLPLATQDTRLLTALTQNGLSLYQPNN